MSTNNMDDKKIKHLEFIQSIITRSNSNSFVIKGWVITIVSAVLALLATTKNHSFIIITALPIIVFWILDSFFLQTERKFRTLYNQVIAPNSTTQAFSLDINSDEIKNSKGNSYFDCFFSRTISGFYFPLILIASICIAYIEKTDEEKKSLKVEISGSNPIKVQTIQPNHKLDSITCIE